MSKTNKLIVGEPVLTIKDLSKVEDAFIALARQVGSTLEEIAADFTKAWELVFGPVFYDDPDTAIMVHTEQPRSPKHSYTFSVQRKRRSIDIYPVYQADLKPPRNLPYQRRNY